MHRFEVVAAITLLAMIGVSSWVVASHLRAISVGPECWPQWEGDGGHLNTCQQLVSRWLDVNEHEAGQLTGFLGYLPAIAGVIIGVPIVSRELEMRTVSLAWSLQGIRWRWLLARLWPMLLIAIVGSALVGIATSDLRVAQESSPFDTGTISDIARQGPVLFSRVVLALGLGALAGAVVGRTLPAFLLAGLLVLAWLLIGGPKVEYTIADAHINYASQEAVYGDNGYGTLHPLVYLDEAYRDPAGHITDGSLYDLLCSGYDAEGTDCPQSLFDGYQPLFKIVPQERPRGYRACRHCRRTWGRAPGDPARVPGGGAQTPGLSRRIAVRDRRIAVRDKHICTISERNWGRLPPCAVDQRPSRPARDDR